MPQNTSQQLINFPKTLAFIAIELAIFEEPDVFYFIDILKDYEIGKITCKCGTCHTFSIIAPNKPGVLGDCVYCGHFGETIAILHIEDGHLFKVEFLDAIDNPFEDEYNAFGTCYKSTMSQKDAILTVKEWFEDNPMIEPEVICLDETDMN